LRYQKVTWSHDDDEEPVLFLSEVGDDGYEVRRVQIFRDDRSEWTDRDHPTESAYLAEDPVPPVVEIASQPDLEAGEITAAEFERAWSTAQAQ
jgi:hypothetical protein